MENNRKPCLVGIVGPCASGKSTLISGLQLEGIALRHIAQEHSYVQDMWKRLTKPDILIFLDASYLVTMQRRNLNWTEEEYAEQHRRLAHARANADCYIQTDLLSSREFQIKVTDFLQLKGVLSF
jgi:guanylate kinase